MDCAYYTSLVAERFGKKNFLYWVSGVVFANSIKDIAGEVIFPDLESIQGRLLFVDCNPNANWGHKCSYILLGEVGLVLQKDWKMPPDTRNIKICWDSQKGRCI